MDKDFVVSVLDMAVKILASQGIPANEIPLAMTHYAAKLPMSFPVKSGDAGSRGLGLFTTRNVKKGQVLTMYPCDYVILPGDTPDVSRVFAAKAACHSPTTEQIDKYKQILKTTRDGNIQTQISADASITHLPHANAHLINDPHPNIGSIKKTPTSAAEYGQALMDYESSVKDLLNCRFEPRGGSYVLAIATKDIDEGQEILVPYGYEYWSELPFKIVQSMLREFFGSLLPCQRAAIFRVLPRLCTPQSE